MAQFVRIKSENGPSWVNLDHVTNAYFERDEVVLRDTQGEVLGSMTTDNWRMVLDPTGELRERGDDVIYGP